MFKVSDWRTWRLLSEGCPAQTRNLERSYGQPGSLGLGYGRFAAIRALNGTTFNGRVLIVRQDVEEDGWADEVRLSSAPATANSSGPSNTQPQPQLLTPEDAELFNCFSTSSRSNWRRIGL
ncbi:hypothetical protein BCR33DRAFT_525203 [Rhizoclosmatium globosum]|uniref:Uncharacterized protein n=1 Tax=Rhizoclosmatium globosum TaxID=329046 RepID=A0A1Y2CTI0_9FUNG|nr:hypothetical protein BCR33DRAFT_525203 [Rhizoclosmatium globosum]|eukprot:ORY50257.1 hypothetical protein BCR33DRAFT_525203 [Rhizoclosmatium globosum]